MAIFGQKGQKVGFYPQNPVFRGFGPFWALFGPWRQGFYINPSRRPPAVPGAAPAGPPRERRVIPLCGVPGASPQRERLQALAPLVATATG